MWGELLKHLKQKERVQVKKERLNVEEKKWKYEIEWLSKAYPKNTSLT